MKLKNLSHEEFLLKLNELEACDEAVNWVEEKNFDLKQTWNTCEIYHWLYWLANKMGVDHKAIVNSACQNAKLVMKFVKKEEVSAFEAIETVEKWCNGDTSITKKFLKSVAYAACAAADASSERKSGAMRTTACVSAANATYSAASAAYAASNACVSGVNATYSAAFAASAASGAASVASDDDFDTASFVACAAASYAEKKQIIQDQILINIRNLIEIQD